MGKTISAMEESFKSVDQSKMKYKKYENYKKISAKREGKRVEIFEISSKRKRTFQSIKQTSPTEITKHTGQPKALHGRWHHQQQVQQDINQHRLCKNMQTNKPVSRPDSTCNVQFSTKLTGIHPASNH